jgi:hypothetical protein
MENDKRHTTHGTQVLVYLKSITLDFALLF